MLKQYRIWGETTHGVGTAIIKAKCWKNAKEKLSTKKKRKANGFLRIMSIAVER